MDTANHVPAIAIGPSDWLIRPDGFGAEIEVDPRTGDLTLQNGLVRRVVRTRGGCCTVGFDQLTADRALIRSWRPEALATIDGAEVAIGGALGDGVRNFLNRAAIDDLRPDPAAYALTGITTHNTTERFGWRKRLEWMPRDPAWPPAGRAVTLDFDPPPALSPGPRIAVHYEIYDGIPLLSKWISLTNTTGRTVRLDRITVEQLAMVEAESQVTDRGRWSYPYPYLHVESDYACGGDALHSAAERGVRWLPDPDYPTQVSYDFTTPCLLDCTPEHGPSIDIAPGETFESYRVFELAYDSGDRERNSLARRRMYRTIAPWVTQNPILMHVRDSADESVRTAIDQCADVGFEMVVMTFGSGFDFESDSPEYRARFRKLSDYARSRGIVLGGYSLLASRSADDPGDNTQDAPPTFGVMPCLGSRWGERYLQRIKDICAEAGLEVFENDGSYPGDECASVDHPGHHGLADSRWVQWRRITELYQWCLANGVYTNVPDWYQLSGCTKVYMGYRETNWALPRADQEIIERQNIFDGTWDKTPSMGWMFVPLVGYHGGGADSTIEPLSEHLDHYGRRLANLFGAGVQACYRGPRLYDTDATRAVVKKWVEFYRRHRSVLDGDLIHLRRADGRTLDYLLHVDPTGPEPGLLMVYNPTGRQVDQTLRIPLYYTGLDDSAQVIANDDDASARRVDLDRDRSVALPVSVPAYGSACYVFTG